MYVSPLQRGVMPSPRPSIESGGPGGRLSYVQSPINPEEWLCWCGQLFTTETAAAECRHIRPRLPVIPREVGFSPRIGFTYGGQPAAERVELPPLHSFTERERRRAGVGAFLVIALWALLMIMLATMPYGTTNDDPGPIVTPSTYGWPGPTGGAFTSMPVAPR
jgi:hypothetical protein